MRNYGDCLVDSMECHIGQTVTVFTASGGLSGSGYTGVLISIDCSCIKLLCSEGAPPACPIGSACCYGGGATPYYNQYPCEFGYNPLGSVAVIPICAIVCFTHNAI